MSNFLNFKVAFKSDIIAFEGWDASSTIEQIKLHISEKTSMPPEAQKLLWKGRLLKDSQATLHSLGIHNESKLLLMGSLPAQIEKVTEMDIKVEERRKIAATVRMKKNGVYRGGAKSNLDSNYTFHKLTVIEEFPKPEQAKKLLEKLRDDRGIRAIMSARKWTVHELTELTPFESSILGYNKNKGQSIAIRLRTDDLSGFRHYDSVRKVLLHELSHNVYSEHDHNFHALNRQLNKDVVNLDWTANGGHVLSRENFYSPDDAEDDMIDNGVTYEAGAYKLGAETSTKTPQDQLSTPEDKRARLAAAAMSRLTKQEEQEMDEGCGSAK